MSLQELTSRLDAIAAPYAVIRHPKTKTALAEAKAIHASAADVAKTVVVLTGTGPVRAVVPACSHLALGKLRRFLDDDETRLATETELRTLYPEFELGAVPPFGGQRREQVVVDAALAQRDTVVVEAGSHTTSLRLAPVDLICAAGARVADIQARV